MERRKKKQRKEEEYDEPGRQLLPLVEVSSDIKSRTRTKME